MPVVNCGRATGACNGVCNERVQRRVQRFFKVGAIFFDSRRIKTESGQISRGDRRDPYPHFIISESVYCFFYSCRFKLANRDDNTS